MQARSSTGASRSTLVALIAVVLLAIAAVALRWVASRTTPGVDTEVAAVDEASSATPAPKGGDDLDLEPFDPAAGLAAGNDHDGPGEPDPGPGNWEDVDFEEIRRAMPDNLYWKMAAPTKDPDVQRQRDEQRARWNTEWGKIQSNTATAEEIDRYYAERQQLSTDYLEFLLHLQKNYAGVIPQRDVGALKLAGEMHVARLEEIPRQIAEAHQRREAAEVARQQWREQQQAFESGGAPPASNGQPAD